MLVLLPAMLFAGQKNKTKKANAETAAWRYEIQNEAVGADNTVLVRVWSYSKSVDVARKQALKNAVHGLISRVRRPTTTARSVPARSSRW